MSFLIKHLTNESISSSAKREGFVRLNSECVLFTKEDMEGKKTLEAKTSDGSIIYFGDLISSPFTGLENDFVSWLCSAKGNFNGVYYTENSTLIFSSIFSILPLFYVQDDKRMYVSDQIENLTPYLKDNTVDDLHFLERILFNYSLTDRTCVFRIRQMPVNSFLKLEKKGHEFYKHTEISSLFLDDPKPLKKSLPYLVDLFNFQLEEYLPNHLFNVSFTSGFDSRSIVSLSVEKRKKFIAYSCGTAESDDVNIPLAISRKMGINYQPILIDDRYLNDVYFESAKRMVINSNGLATIGRAHYEYGSEILSKRSDVMVSGNCGSELLRSSHLDGVLTTHIFFYWIINGLPPTLSEFILIFPEYGFLNFERFSEVYKKLNIELEVKRNKVSHLPINVKLYCLIWEESLRNYFGGELSMQQKYLSHRSPFLDYTFFKEIQKTMASGAYYNYRDKNPVRRMRGQLFYAYLIKKNNRELFFLPTGKGYSPSDILSIEGKLKLIYSKFVKRGKRYESNIDPLFSTKGFNLFYNEFTSKISNKLDGYIDKEKKIDENCMKTVISFSVLFNYLDSLRSQEKLS